MPVLPDHASLDHLRRQAKDQLAELRRAAESASLRDAQALVARQYGYPSWAELKTEVERRESLATVTATPELTAQLCEAFDLGVPAEPMRRLERQWTGDLWELATDRGRWAVTALADWITSIESEGEFVTAALVVGVEAPVPVRSNLGTFGVTVDGVIWCVHEAIRLGPPLPQPPSLDDCAEGGRVLARLHSLDVPAPGPVVEWLTQRQPEPMWRQLAAQAVEQSRVWAPRFDAAIPGYLELAAVTDERDPNDRAILSKAWHAPSACRSAGPGRLVLTGWEHTSALPVDWDFGASVMAWSETPTGFDIASARAFASGYEEIGEPIERSLRIFTSGISGALNWVISRANIAMNDCDERQREDAERLIRTLVEHPVSLRSITSLLDSIS